MDCISRARTGSVTGKVPGSTPPARVPAADGIVEALGQLHQHDVAGGVAEAVVTCSKSAAVERSTIA